MGQHHYYTLVTSLPRLPRFDQAERLPITRKELDIRLKMLEPQDLAILKAAESYLFWRDQTRKENDTELIKQFGTLMEMTMPPELKEFISFRASERTIMVALRRKFRGFPAPSAKEVWGVGPWVSHIERHWEAPDFSLAAANPWVPKARDLLHAHETLELERLIVSRSWKLLDQFVVGKEFLFESVVAYVFKWNILQYWLGFNAEAARDRFATLVEEVYGEHAKFITA